METKDIVTSVLTGTNIVITLLNLYVVDRIRRRQDAYVKNYSELDKAYDALLKDANANPNFRNPDFTSGYKKIEGVEDEIAQKYEIYAFRCMNFCETIFDTCDKKLLETWGCIIKSEGKLHSAWFSKAESKERFKKTFKEYVENSCKAS
ncbi:MAG TPA: hypothetical protein VNM35_10270 [Chitinophagaceae bacterium]|jgi:hypothetical protein|nr:hypothetical protein [Chitinophagaceae bacterium]